MDLPLALHTAARRFCIDQETHWMAEYQKLEKSGAAWVLGVPGSWHKWEKSTTALSVFPRSQLDKAIGMEVEKLNCLEFESLIQARRLLLEASERAWVRVTGEFQRNREACGALHDELKQFQEYISNLETEQVRRVEPLPYRRILNDRESKKLRNDLRDRWGLTGSYWYPLAESPEDTNVIAFQEEQWVNRDGASLLLHFLEERYIDRCFLLEEHGPDYEVDCALIDTTRHEFFVTREIEWLLYVSHEDSISVTGLLADFFRTQWRDWRSITCIAPL